MKIKLFYRIFGNFILISFFWACQKEYDFSQKFIYQNDTNGNVTIIFYYGNDNTLSLAIEEMKSISIEDIAITETSHKNEEPFNYFPSYPIHPSDSIKVIFESTKQNVYFQSDTFCEAKNPYCKNSYTVNQLGNRSFEYIFMITQGDYENAQDCEGECE